MKTTANSPFTSYTGQGDAYNAITGGYAPAALVAEAAARGLVLEEMADEAARGLIGITISADEVDATSSAILAVMRTAI